MRRRGDDLRRGRDPIGAPGGDREESPRPRPRQASQGPGESQGDAMTKQHEDETPPPLPDALRRAAEGLRTLEPSSEFAARLERALERADRTDDRERPNARGASTAR